MEKTAYLCCAALLAAACGSSEEDCPNCAAEDPSLASEAAASPSPTADEAPPDAAQEVAAPAMEGDAPSTPEEPAAAGEPTPEDPVVADPEAMASDPTLEPPMQPGDPSEEIEPEAGEPEGGIEPGENAEAGMPERNEIAETTFADPFGPNAEWRPVADTGNNTEGPTWVPEENGFVFYSGGTRLYLWELGADDHSVWFEFPNGMGNHGNHYHGGIVYNANRTPGEIGRIRVADMSYDAMPFDPDATPEFSGQVLDLGNDLDRFIDGSVYFSEFAAASPRSNHVGRSIYRLHTDARLERVIDDTGSPNGVQFSADCRKLYTTHGGYVHEWDVDDDGNLSNRRPLDGGDGGANGLTVDAEGNVYVSSRSGITLFNRQGEEVMTWGDMRSINMAFGGPEHETLFVTTNSGYGWVNMRVPGAECSGLGTSGPEATP